MARTEKRPSIADVRNLWNKRHANRPSPLLIIILYGDAAAVCGPVGPDPAVEPHLELGQIERIARAALEEPDRHAAIRLLQQALPEASSDLPGLRNVGMFASHQLREGVPRRSDWSEFTREAKTLLDLRGQDLVKGLGFDVETHGSTTSLLVSNGRKYAVAVFLDESETPEAPSARFANLSPVSQGLAAADAEQLPFVVVTRGSQIRVYSSRNDVGVGRKGRAETFVEVNLALLPDDRAGYLPLIFGASALKEGGSFWILLEDSKDFASELGKRLRERVYDQVVPSLAGAIADQFAEEPDEADLTFLYEQALVILYRLLFIAYAEDKDLLPYRTNGRYQARSLKNLARELSDRANEGDGEVEFDENQTDLWERVQSLSRAVDRGHTEWGVPPYDGGLFGIERERAELGEEIRDLELTNAQIGPPLLGLLVDASDEGPFGPVDFRSLSVREFGTIYEGLLQNDLAVATADLSLDRNNVYVPSRKGDRVAVEEGAIYLHNKSGARKASGSYFTKPFAVDHLLDHALEPALEEHVQRLDELLDADEELAAAEAFFDFRCADIAMGSGHFLVAAVDRIEARLSSFLARRPIPGVIAELDRLRTAAYEALGEHGHGVDIEHASLLRRQVARRCVYGVDLNRIAVELARLSLWIHTFVPGLPLSFLNHNLVEGNSLTGIGEIDEAIKILDPTASHGTVSILREQIEHALSEAKDALKRLARTADATAAEITEARKAHSDSEQAILPVHVLFDLLIGVRLGEVRRFERFEKEEVLAHPDRGKAEEVVGQLEAIHFPIAFPEVFLRDRPGFDCLIGNPPWDKVMFEPQQFWVVRAPGLNALPADLRDEEIERMRKRYPHEAQIEESERSTRQQLQAYVRTSFTRQGSGHLDYAKLFTERALNLLAATSALGYVLPAQALVLAGWAKLRAGLLVDATTTCVQTQNRGGWLFEDVEHRNMHILFTRKTPARFEQPALAIWGGIKSKAQLARIRTQQPLKLTPAELAGLSEGYVIPRLGSESEAELFRRLSSREKLGVGRGWIKGIADTRWDFRDSSRFSELASTHSAPGAWNILMTRHVRHFGLVTEGPFQRFVTEPSKLVSLKRGAIHDRSGTVVLDSSHPAIVYRHPSTNTNRRTMIASPLPQAGFLFNAGYVHGLATVSSGTEEILGFLGYLNTYICDWWVRRLVDRHVTAQVIRGLPLPSWSEEEVRLAAGYTAELVRREGVFALPGGDEVKVHPVEEALDSEEILGALEHLAARGFGFGVNDLEIILTDFSAAGCPDGLRARLLAGWNEA